MSHTNAPLAPLDMSSGDGHIHADGTRHGDPVRGGESGIGRPAARASVALDIGRGLGALVITPGERFRDREIEISRVDHDGPRVHTGVHERASDAGPGTDRDLRQPPAGRYVIWEDAETAGPVVDIPDGAVAQIALH